MAWLNGVLLIGLVMVSSTNSSHDEVGVSLSLKGEIIANNSYVDIDDIGEDENALLCHTNKTDCCIPPNRAGEWYYPNGTRVGIQGYYVYGYGYGFYGYEFYRNRGTQVVRLNRQQGTFTARGRFRCVVPNGNYYVHTIYVNIVDIVSVTISPSGPIIKNPESNFSLVCSANTYPLISGPPPIIFEWFFGPENSSLPSDVVVSNVTITGNNFTSTLQFSPLYKSHTGVYTCRVGYLAASIIIFAGDPTININSVGTRTAGGNYSLMCIVTGVRINNSIVNYNWTKDNGTAQTVIGNSGTLFFSPLKLSDAGQYLCKVMIGSQMYGAIEYVNIEIPAPILISVTSNPTSPIRPIGSAVTLICTVMLSPAVDVPVTVNLYLSDPAGSPLITTTPSVSGSNYKSTAMVNSFGREDSGLYMCTVSTSSTFPFIRDSNPNSVASKVTIGVYLSLKGNVYTNNSVIFVSEIGETDDNSIKPTQNEALQCITDRSPCCRFFPNTAGEWYFPNGTVIPEEGADSTAFYRNRGFDDGTVNLNLIDTLSSVSIPTGLFCCVLPDMDGINQRLCADIDHVIVTITTSGNSTAGEIYSLECSINGGYSAIFQWVNESGNNQDSRIITASPSSSLLEFSPLHQSHGGTYTCSANISDTIVSKSVQLLVKAPTITVQITGGEVTPNIGREYNLTCSIFGAENLNDTLAYEWRNKEQLLSNSSIFQLPSLKLSDAGRYTCQVSVTSSYLYNSITATEYQDLVIKIPDPLSVRISYNKVSPIRPIGSDVILTCSVELSALVDVPIIVNTVWTGPAGFRTTINTAQSVMGSNTSYTSAVTVRSFGRRHSGLYTCAAQVTSSQNSQYYVTNNARFSVFGEINITVGVYLTLNGQVYSNNSVITKAEIAETANGLQCVTDKMPCCQTGPRVGEWNFPNGSAIPEQGSHTTFFVSRGDSGTVNLNLVDNSSISSTSGQFCCVIPDANGLSQTQCALLIPTLLVKVTSKGNIIPGGQGFSLKCTISGEEALNSILTYQWTKNNSTRRLQVGSNTSTLSFPSLRLSDAGQYSCQVRVSSRYLRDALNVTSAPFDVHLQVPEPIVRLVSDTPNPILSGSSPTLTCAVELSPAVDVPVAISTVWIGPDGSILMSGAPPVMKSFTHYTSKVKLNYVESADSGNYNCTVNIVDKINVSVEKKITIGDDMFQLRLMYTDDCRTWYKSGNNDFELYKYHIEEALIEAIESRCECYFPRVNLLKASFSCASSPNLTTYRNTLIGTHNFNATQLIGFIQDWVTSAPQINIKDYSAWLDSSCPVAIASLKEPECGEVRHCPCANDPNVIKCMEFLGNDNFAGCINSCI